MPTTRNLIELFRAIASEDVPTASAIASQICQVEEKKGHKSAARSLRGALLRNDTSRHANAPRNDAGFLHTGLVQLLTDISLIDVVLSAKARKEIGAVADEWAQRKRLITRGLKPRSKLLFHGPPGCGKSLTARALAHELGLPIYLVRFDSVIGSYLGQTAIHLRQLFHFTESTPCVLLLDELDALGKRRGNPLDVGELDRIVISLMQELEHSNPLGLIIATSNLAKNLDEALWRRFDLTLQFQSPTKSALSSFCRKLATKYDLRIPQNVSIAVSKSRSFAEAESLVITEARRQTLADQ